MDYRPIIESRYNRTRWQELLHDIFHNRVAFWEQPRKVPADEKLARQALYIGEIVLPDRHKIAIYEVELTDSVVIERNRAGIRNLLCTDWRGRGCFGAFMFCFRHNESALRFSYVKEGLVFSEDGSLKKESTDTKRFTYLLGEGHRSRTAIKQFEELKNSKLDSDALTKAFSVEALSDIFFKEYKKHYEDIVEHVTGKRIINKANKWIEKDNGNPRHDIMQEFSRFPDAEKAVRDYVKKLMGRLVFIQFLQKKGWMGCPAGDSWENGDREFVQNLFANTPHKDTFIDDVLEPLFDDINTKREGDLSSNANVGLGIKIPYLNGGLFEKDEYDKTAFPLPAKYMKDMLDFFASYNFTIDENDPDDAEIGVDPEMLGRIFENLLEDNKDKGAFYTPKEIVQYMCRESLIAYLQTEIEDENIKESIRQFVTTHEASALTQQLKEIVDEALKDVKICDPAIGSGAFPMGLLRDLYACRKAIEDINDEKAVSIKTEIIQNNIYGVDIEKGAVDIARLRFWLALIVDEKTPHALPNMDFKIMQGNSLLEQYEGVDLSTVTDLKTERKETTQLSIFEDEVDLLRRELRNLLNEYYGCSDQTRKAELRTEISDNVKQQLKEQQIKVDFGDLDLLGNDQFFLWHTWFHDVFSKGGFDIVIGNPPFVSAPTQVASSILANQRNLIAKSGKYETLFQKWDLYIPFMEMGLRLLSHNGSFSMIVPYPVTNQLYAKMFRKWILQNYHVSEIADLNGTKIFDNATVSNVILFASATESRGETRISHIYESKEIKVDFVQEEANLVQDEKTLVWNLTQEKRQSNRHPEMHVLGDFCYISVGMVINADEKTAKGEFTKEDLISETKDEIHCREYIEAKDISRYVINNVRYLEYGTDRVPQKLRRPTFKELYERPKLICNRLGQLQMMIDDRVYYLQSDSSFICMLWGHLTGVNNKSIISSIKRFSKLQREQMEDLSNTVDLRFLLGIMNSNYARVLLANLRGGDYHIYPEHIRNIPIPTASSEQQQPIISLVETILQKKKDNVDTASEEHEIDRLVYQLYGLTNAEVRIIDPNEPISGSDDEPFKA